MPKSIKPEPEKKLVKRQEFLGAAATMAGAMFLGRGAGPVWPGISAAALGPSQTTYMADRLKDRLDGKPMQTKHMKVDAAGQIHDSTFEVARKALSIPL